MKWLRMKLDSAITCAFGFHRACDGIAALRRPPYELPCDCRCHR